MGNPILFPPYQKAYVYNGEREWFVAFNYYDREAQKYKREKIRVRKRGMTHPQREILLQQICAELNKLIAYRNEKGLYHKPSKDKSRNTMQQSLLEWADQLKDDAELSDTPVSGSPFSFSLQKTAYIFCPLCSILY